jgi:DNA topoisomerase VI subunit B
MAEEKPTPTIEEIVASVLTKVNSQIEKIQIENVKRLKEAEDTIQKLAELGKQQSEQLANLINSVNDMGKRMENPPKRISPAKVEETGKGFETLLED